ncbi:MAG TPA: flagellar assembly protein FliH [Oleiagrimonas sp.]|nr:flagellar assembly protein FliH [Oleiagrimonas sp.]
MSDAQLERREHWRRWHMGELTPSRPSLAQEHPREFRVQPQLRELRETARAQAHREGYAAGLAQGRDEGYEQGLVEGREAGKTEWDSRRRELLEPLVALADNLKHALAQLDTDIGEQLTDVTLAAARQLAGEALDAHPEYVLERIRGLLRDEPIFSGTPRLWLHPDDLALIDDELADELQAAGWKPQPDPQLERGDCHLTGPEGELSATREQRWQSLLARARRTDGPHSEPTAPPATPEAAPP